MATNRRLRARRVIELALFVSGLALAEVYALMYARSAWFQSAQAAALEETLRDTSGLPPRALVAGDLVGRLEVPRLDLSVIVVEGDQDSALSVAAGHLPDTPLPWVAGNSAIAGHRDTFFRPLKDVQVNDEIRLVTRQGDFTYRVTRTAIVDGDDVSVLSGSNESMLTLVTCYPFTYVGPAPRRFIVQATRI